MSDPMIRSSSRGSNVEAIARIFTTFKIRIRISQSPNLDIGKGVVVPTIEALFVSRESVVQPLETLSKYTWLSTIRSLLSVLGKGTGFPDSCLDLKNHRMQLSIAPRSCFGRRAV
jgi:hypothetical protein